jgi:hypothetical protein
MPQETTLGVGIGAQDHTWLFWDRLFLFAISLLEESFLPLPYQDVACH